MLTIPAIGRAPRSFRVHTVNPLCAKAALALLELGAIPPAPVASQSADLIRRGLKRWLDERTVGIRRFDFHLHCREANGRGPFGDDLGRVLLIDFSSSSETPNLIGPGVTKCERAITGLGQTALHWLDQAARVLPLYTPMHALWFACMQYWGGEDDEKAYLAEMLADGDKAEDIEILTRAQFDKTIPRWASAPQKKVSRKGLEHLANPKRTTITGRVARALLVLVDALAESKRVKFPHPQSSMDYLPFCLWLRWSDDDHSGQIFDDFANHLHEAGDYREELAQFALSIEDDATKALRGFLSGIEAAFPIANAIDGLVEALGDRSNRTLAEVFQ